MAWTKPIDWIDGHRYTAADLNKVSANFQALRTGAIAVPGQTAGHFIVAIAPDQFGSVSASDVSAITHADLEAKLVALTERIAVLEGKIP